MELRMYFRMLRRGWWIIALAALAALNIALILSYSATPIYQATARLLVTPNPNLVEGQDAMIYSLDTLDKRSIVSTYSEVLSSRRLLSEAASGLGVSVNHIEENYTIKSVVLPEANVVQLTVQGPDPELAVNLANTLGQLTIDFTNRVYKVFTTEFLDTAEMPDKPVKPVPARNAGVALLLGLVVGATLAILRGQLAITVDNLRERTRYVRESGAYNARFFQQQLEETVRQQPEKLSLGLIEMDVLQDLIETLPRSVSERILRQIAQTVQVDLRGGDIVGRVGQDRFAVMLPGTPIEAGSSVLHRIQQALSKPVQIEEYDGLVDLSPRVAVVAYQLNQTAQDLLTKTERDLERARPQMDA